MRCRSGTVAGKRCKLKVRKGNRKYCHLHEKKRRIAPLIPDHLWDPMTLLGRPTWMC